MKSLINHASRHSAHTPSVFKNQCPRESRLLTSHISCFPASFFYKDLRLAAQKGESTYLIRAILFLFLITYSTSHVLMLMSYSVSAHLASSFSFPHINSPHHRELLFLSTEEQEDKRYKKIIKINPGCEKVSGPEPESRKHGGDRLASPRSGRSANRRGEKVFTATLFSEFNRRNVMSIKGDKNFNTSICSGNASKPQNLTSGVELLSGCQKMCQVSICFIRCTRFLLFLARFVLNNPQTFFIS